MFSAWTFGEMGNQPTEKWTSPRRGCQRAGCVAFLVLLLCGCGPQGPGYPATRLEGAVAVDGKPLATGSIQFLPADTAQGPAVGAVVTDGRYAVDDVPLGRVRAIVTSVRKGKRLPDVGDMPVWESENLIPQQHRGGILIDVKADRPIQDFKL